MANLTDPTQELDIIRELESFLYTPYGVSTVAGAAILLTCLLWCLGCCVYCLHRRARSTSEGTLEVSREIEYIGMSTLSSNHKREHRDGTMSSGYSTGPTTHNTLNSQTGNVVTLTSSVQSLRH